MQKRRKKKKAFTMIEMMVVIAVIGIVAGMVFKVFSVAVRNANKAKTIQILQVFAHLVNEYKAEYGICPPVQPIKTAGGAYTPVPYGTGGIQPSYMIYENVSVTEEYFASSIPYLSSGFGNPTAPPRVYGLLAYFEPNPPFGLRNDRFHEGDDWRQDNERDAAFKKRVWAIWEKIRPTWGWNAGGFEATAGSGVPLRVNKPRVLDGWGSIINYESLPPHSSYRLWSNGPDGNNDNGGNDDIIAEQTQ